MKLQTLDDYLVAGRQSSSPAFSISREQSSSLFVDVDLRGSWTVRSKALFATSIASQ